MEITEKKYNIAVLGGDIRQKTVTQILRNRGHIIKTCNKFCAANEEEFTGAAEAVKSSQIIILPLPATGDNVHLTCAPVSGNRECEQPDISIYDLIRNNCNNEKKYILGGKLPALFSGIAEKNGYDVTDYFLSETLQLKNALPTAEGALMTCMENLRKTIRGSRFAILGYGRIGKILAGIIKNLGGQATVFARRDETLESAADMGFCTFKLQPKENLSYCREFASVLNGCDAIFNTVPSIIVGRATLEHIERRPIFIELASAPGGFDTEAARDTGHKIIFAPSLPGRYAPESAGQYISDEVIYIMSQKGIFL